MTAAQIKPGEGSWRVERPQNPDSSVDPDILTSPLPSTI